MKAQHTITITIPIIVRATSTTKTVRGRNRRRLEANKIIVDTITNTEVWSSAESLLASSREEPADGVSSRNSSPCSSPSANWIHRQMNENDISDEDASDFFDWYVYALPFAYKLFVEPSEGNTGREYFGLDGEYSREIAAVHERVRDFWSDSGVDDDIRVLCAHGSDLADRHDKLVPTLELMFGETYDAEYTVLEHATDIQELIRRLPGGYNFPLLTFNAFATRESDRRDHSYITVGDGFFEFQHSVGLGSEGPEYALAHEHAHHLQYALDEEENGSGRDDDAKRKELMADALSAYFLAHDGGGEMTAEELSNVHEVAYSVGDCRTNDEGHHGTPHQRRCATRWGASIFDASDVAAMNLIDIKNEFDVWYNRIEDLNELCEHAISEGCGLMTVSLRVVAVLFGSAAMLGF